MSSWLHTSEANAPKFEKLLYGVAVGKVLIVELDARGGGCQRNLPVQLFPILKSGCLSWKLKFPVCVIGFLERRATSMTQLA